MWQQRDVAAFSDLVATRSVALLRTAYLVVGDHQLAQDLVQESLVKTYVAWPRLRDVTKAEAYARRTIVTTAISWRRRRSFHERPVLAIPEQAQPDRTDTFATQDLLWAQVCALPPRQRAALVLRFYEDLSESDTAQLMGCAVGTVKSQVSAGLDRLRQRMGPELVSFLADDPEVTS
jgi:RNA polymerase sigma-70 factor (sigma-E family)